MVNPPRIHVLALDRGERFRLSHGGPEYLRCDHAGEPRARVRRVDGGPSLSLLQLLIEAGTLLTYPTRADRPRARPEGGDFE